MLDSNLTAQSDRMISNQHTENGRAIESHSWSNRFLTLAVAGILFLTMYPFELSAPKPYRSLPLLLGSGGKGGGLLDIFLNILLFVPFGFALGTKLLRRGKSWGTILICTLAAGALFSYAIELTQLYVPFRDSGWQDVFTNTTGSVIGGVAAFLISRWVFSRLTAMQQAVRTWATPRRLAAVLLIYFGVWCVASAFLLQKISVRDWRTDSLLVFGNDATGLHPWKGHLLRVEIWDRAIPDKLAAQLTSSTGPAAADEPIVNLDFGNERPVASGNRPAAAATPQQAESLVMSASPTLSDFLVRRVQQSNQFALRVVLAPPQTESSGRILALSQRSGFLDFYLNQLNDELVFWFRTPVTVHWHRLSWRIPHAMSTGQIHTALFSYDGATFSSYMDGKEIESRSLGVQTALASYVRYLNENELKGYRDIFYAIIFFPAGALLGIGIARPLLHATDRLVIAAAGVLLPSVLFEWIVTRASRAPFSFVNVAFSATYVILGLLWMNADGLLTNVPASSGASVETTANP